MNGDPGKNFVTWNGAQATLIVTELDLIKEILNNNQAYTKSRTGFIVKKLVGNGLATSEGKKWAKQRKIANHAFYAESLKVSFCFLVAFLNFCFFFS